MSPSGFFRSSLLLSFTAFVAVSAYTRQSNEPTHPFIPYYPHYPPMPFRMQPNINPIYHFPDMDKSQRMPDMMSYRFNPFQAPDGPDFDIRAFSCAGRCDTKGHDKTLPCQCNKRCVDFDDCCSDYGQMCLSCDGRCNSRFNPSLPCQCTNKCSNFDSCCDDFEDECGDGDDKNEVVSDADLSTLSEQLLSADTNNVASLVTIDLQGSTSFSSSRDNAPKPLLTVKPAAYQKTTIAKLLPLHNNYVANVGTAEVVTSEESSEETAFLDAILTTDVMKKTEKFLIDKGFVTTRRRLASGAIRTNNRAFRDALHQIWFGMYPRENSTLGSSGFEHVFLGEVKDGKVSGFHNWIFLSKEEANNRLNYKGKIGTAIDLGSKGRIIKHKFDWNNTEKPITSMFVGTSPEFEMALYTVCYYVRPGQRCTVKLNDKNVRIQTYYMNKYGKRYVASAYPDI